MKPGSLLVRHWFSKILLFLLVFLVFFSIPFLHGLVNKDQGYGLASNREAPAFNLKKSDNSRVSLDDFRGKYTFLMFGYLNCDDICHSQALLFQEINLLADMGDELHFLYLAMDPDRDSPSQLAAYFDQRGENFSSLRNNSFKSAQQLAGKYRAFFAPDKNMHSGDYEISHPGLFFLIGPDGYLRFTYTANQTETRLIVDDLLALRNEYIKQ